MSLNYCADSMRADLVQWSIFKSICSNSASLDYPCVYWSRLRLSDVLDSIKRVHCSETISAKIVNKSHSSTEANSSSARKPYSSAIYDISQLVKLTHNYSLLATRFQYAEKRRTVQQSNIYFEYAPQTSS